MFGRVKSYAPVLLMSVLPPIISWGDSEWDAFKQLTDAMGCTKEVAPFIEAKAVTSLSDIKLLNPIFQDYFFRAGKSNPFGAAKERFGIAAGEYTERHAAAAKALRELKIHHETIPTDKELEGTTVVAVLGSTVPNMSDRIRFASQQALTRLKPDGKCLVLGLSGERKLIPANPDKTRGYLGDVLDNPVEGSSCLNKAEAESTKASYQKDGSPTESGAMSFLAQKILPKEWLDHWHVIDAKAKPGKDRPDTEDTAYYAAVDLQAKGLITSSFKIVVVSDACFPGQKEQIRSGFLRAGICLSDQQILFCGRGYPEEVFNIPAYVQIGASAVAEQHYNLMVRLSLEEKYKAEKTEQIRAELAKEGITLGRVSQEVFTLSGRAILNDFGGALLGAIVGTASAANTSRKEQLVGLMVEGVNTNHKTVRGMSMLTLAAQVSDLELLKVFVVAAWIKRDTPEQRQEFIKDITELLKTPDVRPEVREFLSDFSARNSAKAGSTATLFAPPSLPGAPKGEATSAPPDSPAGP